MIKAPEIRKARKQEFQGTNLRQRIYNPKRHKEPYAKRRPRIKTSYQEQGFQASHKCEKSTTRISPLHTPVLRRKTHSNPAPQLWGLLNLGLSLPPSLRDQDAAIDDVITLKVDRKEY